MLATLLGIFGAVLLLHAPLLRLPYFWDEAGYYIPAALDFYHAGLLIPQSTLPTGHTPLVTVYLALAWHLCGFSPLATRAAMLLMATAAVLSVYALGRRLVGREVAVWGAALLALMPLFFAQSSLAHLDLPAALFTTLAVLFLIEDRLWGFALAASLAVLSKETAVVLLPVAWVYAWRARRDRRGVALQKDSEARHAVPRTEESSEDRGVFLTGKPGVRGHASLQVWVALAAPLVPLAAWAVYYHHATGYWTGNPEYLAYNLHSTLNPGRIFWTLLRRLYEILVGGFDWLLAGGALLGVWWRPKSPLRASARGFLWLSAALGVIYVLMLSAVGGAILPRYLLPVFPALILAGVILIWGLPPWMARGLCAATAAAFIGGWFINPPYPFPFEDNLAYADFVRLHQDAAKFLEAQPGQPRILTAWPASDELTRPFLGYVYKPLHVVPVEGFTAEDFREVPAGSFNLLYLYSRKWEPPNNWLKQYPVLTKLQEHYYGYHPQIPDDALATRYRLRLLRSLERRGQWVRIYTH
jgi:hypothetical protein